MKILYDAIEETVNELERKSLSESYKNDPVAWAEYMLGIKLWSKQREIAQSVVHNKSVAVKAGHGVGKSFLVAVLVCWWIDTRYPEVFVASTAPSTAQINAIVWREVRKMKNAVAARYQEYKSKAAAGMSTAGLPDHDLPGYITADAQWKTAGGQILGFGRKPPDNKEDDSFQGLHDGYVLAIGDEACGLTEDLIGALGNIVSNAGSRRILIANPTNPHSYFGKIFRENKANWAQHTISVLDSPNFTDEGKEMSPEALEKLTDSQFVADYLEEYGEESPRYISRVLGEFAFDADNTLITQADIDVAKAAEIIVSDTIKPVLGVDVARMGGDRTTVYSNLGGRIRFIEGWSKAATTETANRVHRIAIDEGVSVVFVDSDGVGGGVKDQLVAICEDRYIVVEVHGSAASPDRRQWHNFRAYAWDSFRSRCRNGNIDLDPEDIDLQDELLSVEYFFNKTSGGLQIESKEDMHSRGLKSPDLADGAIYASIEFDINDPLAGFNSGDKIHTSASDILGSEPIYLQLMSSF